MPTCLSVKTGKLVCWTLTSLCHSRMPSWAWCHPFPSSQLPPGCAPGWLPSCLQDTHLCPRKTRVLLIRTLDPSTISLWTYIPCCYLQWKEEKACICSSMWKARYLLNTTPRRWQHPLPQDFIYPIGQEPASALVLSTVLSRSWVLFLLTLLSSKGIPKIIPVFQISHLCSMLRTWLYLHTTVPRLYLPCNKSLSNRTLIIRWLGTRSGHWNWERNQL